MSSARFWLTLVVGGYLLGWLWLGLTLQARGLGFWGW
jgi:hypothetical protein